MNGPELVERLISARDQLRAWKGDGPTVARAVMADAANYITDYINGAKAAQDALANALADEREETIALRAALAAANARGEEMAEMLRRVDQHWSEDFPGGPNGDVTCFGGLGRIADSTLAIWRDIRATLHGEPPHA